MLLKSTADGNTGPRAKASLSGSFYFDKRRPDFRHCGLGDFPEAFIFRLGACTMTTTITKTIYRLCESGQRGRLPVSG
jgi:hypothetical protein